MRLHKNRLAAGAPLLLMLGSASLAQIASGPPTNLTPESVTKDYVGKPSLNGQKVTYTRQMGHFSPKASVYDVYVMNADGSNKQQVVFSGSANQDEWSALNGDGTRVVFHRFVTTPNTEIYIVDLVTGEELRMTTSPTPIPTNTGSDAFPVFSPDGSKIIWLSQRNSAGINNIFMLNADKPENTTDNKPIQLTNATTAAAGASRPRFSADGQHIFFLGPKRAGAGADIYRMDAVDTDNDGWGDNLVRLTDAETIKAGSTIHDPSQGTPGGRIFFGANFSPDNRNHVYSMNPDGTDIKQITAAEYVETFPTVTANNKLFLTIQDAAVMGVDNDDMAVYDLTDATGNGTVSGVLTRTLGQPIEGITVKAYNGNTVVGEVTTDAQGAYSFTLPAGGYVLQFSNPSESPGDVNVSTVTRGVLITPDANVVQNAFTSLIYGRRPTGVIPTIQADGSVSVRWVPQAPAASSGYTLTGFDVFRSSSPDGPWTKINTELVTDTVAPEFVDTNPGDLTSAYYSVVSVNSHATDGTVNISNFADAGQAANNLLFNPSFELVNAASPTQMPLGWELMNGTASITSTAGTDTSAAITGARSAYLQAGSTKGDTYLNVAVPYYIPTTSESAYIQGLYIRFKDAPTTAGARSRYTYSVSEPNVGPFLRSGTTVVYPGTGWEVPSVAGGGAANANKDWTHSVNTATVRPYEFSTYSRFSAFWTTDAAAVADQSRALFDEARFQVKRVGPTGIIAGRVFDSAGTAVSGVTVSDGTRTTTSSATGQFALRDVPTGNVTITLSYPGQPDVVRQVRNIGGYMFNDTVAFPNVIPASFGGRVFLPNGQPAAGAKVAWVVGNITTDGAEQVYEATTDASGKYLLDTSGAPVDTTKKIWAVAHLAGYKATYVKDQSLAGGGAGIVGFDLTLGERTPLIEVGRATSAPIINGVVNASEWAASQEISQFLLFPTKSPYAVPTRAYALWDNDNLYIAMVADEPVPSGIRAQAVGLDDTAMWGDDNFQMFLDPLRSAGIGYGRDVWQIGMNTANAVTDGVLSIGPFAQNLNTVSYSAATVASTVNAATNRWTVEASIPWSGLNVGTTFLEAPSVGDEWTALFARYRSQDLTNAATSSMAAKFAEPEKWNTLRFVNTVTPPTITALEALRIAGGLQAASSTAGDTNASGTITLEDALALLRANGLQ